MNKPTYYQLTESQRLMLFTLQYCPHKQIVNICVEIEFQEEMDLRLILQALYMSVLRNPAASVRLHTMKDKSVMQYFSEEAPERIEYLDFSDKTLSQYEDQVKKWNTTAFPNKQMDTQLYMIKLLKKPNGKQALYGCFSHLIYDAYSVMDTFRDLCDIYDALGHGKPVKEPWISPIPAYEMDYAYRKSEKYLADRKFYDEVVYTTEPQYTTINGRYSSEFSTKTKYGQYYYSPSMAGDVLNLPIDEDINAKVENYAQEQGISVQVLYLLAIRSYLASCCQVDDVTINNALARRATLKQKRAGGTMVNPVMIRTIFDQSISFKEGCERMYKAQMEAYRHANLGCGEAISMGYEKFGTPKGKTYTTVSLTYQPYFTLENAPEVKFHRMTNGRATQMLYLSVMPYDVHNHMLISYEYQTGILKSETIQKFHQGLLTFLERGVNDPEASIESLIEGLA